MIDANLTLAALVLVAAVIVLIRRAGRRAGRTGSRSNEPPAGAAEPQADSGSPVQMTPQTFDLGKTYTRTEIHDALGGGVQDYLPHVRGVVVCGCFNPDLNPDAPDVVLPGFGPAIERWADAFAQQGTAVPCFLKRATNAWEYVGEFRVRELSRSQVEIERWASAAHREGDVSMVLHMEEVH